MDEQTQQQNQPEQQLTKKERRQMRREEKRVEEEHARKARGQKNIFIWIAVFAVVTAVGFGVYKYLFDIAEGDVAFDPTKTCVNHGGISMHIHPELSIVINGVRQEIPANIGVSPGCMRPIHTHDASGRLHNEFPQRRNFTLGEFFKIWDKPFSSRQILDYVADETSQITIKVNGESNTDYENLILKDRDQIEIRYEETQASE